MQRFFARAMVVILLFVMIVIGRENFGAFMGEHAYYSKMLSNAGVWWMVVKGLLFAAIPVVYIVLAKIVRGRTLFGLFALATILFGLAHVSFKGGGTMGSASGSMMLVLTMVLFLALMSYFVVSVAAVGSLVNRYTFRLAEDDMSQILLVWGMGLGVFLLLNHFLIIAGLFMPVISFLLFVAGGVVMYMQRVQLAVYCDAGLAALGSLSRHARGFSPWTWVGIVLLLFSLLYFFFGLQLSWIPYPTAWDANHAYMFYPKVWAAHGGYPRGESIQGTPFLWMSYVAYRFSLLKPTSSWLWVSADTVAIVMNFLSGVFVLLFGLATIKQVIARCLDKVKGARSLELPLFSLGWLFLLLWLSSGMGAFLVFVDNKNDLGIMALTLLAMLSGFVMLRHIKLTSKKLSWAALPGVRYALVSGLFFALAVMGKPTAFVDALVFVLVLLGMAVGGLALVGLTAVIVVVLAKLGILGMKTYIPSEKALPWLIGAMLAVPGFAKTLYKRSFAVFAYASVWAVSLVVSLVVLKSPHILYEHFITPDRDASDLLKGYLMGDAGVLPVAPELLLVSTGLPDDLKAPVESQSTPKAPLVPTPQACSLGVLGVSDVDVLYDRMKEIQGGGIVEDFGRYVGFGQRGFATPATWSDEAKSVYGPFRLGYGVLRLLFGKVDHCYTTNATARALCEQQDDLSVRDADVLLHIANEVGEGTDGLLTDMVARVEDGEVFAQDALQSLQTYWKERVVYVDEQHQIQVPYRFLTFLNVVYNRSLQNHSSYYTDIGFVRLLLFICTLLAVVAGAIYRERKLLVLSVATIMGWIVWFFIASGIVWYGMGLVVWTSVVTVLFLGTVWRHGLDQRSWKLCFGIAVGLLVMWCGLQLVMNFVRIAHQGSGGPFVSYKQSRGVTSQLEVVGQRIAPTSKTVMPYKQDDVFERQFGHYQPTLDYVARRAPGDGMLVAGTYMTYFLDNFENVKYDGLVSHLWQWMSDGDICAGALRLRDQHIKYISIDPNIATVVMGKGNSSLFHRFLVKVDDQGKRIDNGVLAYLAEYVLNGYVKYIHSNNIGILYAYALPSEELLPYMEQLGETDEIMFRTKLAGARFFQQDLQRYINVIGDLFVKRLQNGQAMGDLAAIYGYSVDQRALYNLVQVHRSGQGGQLFVDTFNALTTQERQVYTQYMNLLQLAQSNPEALNKELSSLISRSISGGSQIATFELTL